MGIVRGLGVVVLMSSAFAFAASDGGATLVVQFQLAPGKTLQQLQLGADWNTEAAVEDLGLYLARPAHPGADAALTARRLVTQKLVTFAEATPEDALVFLEPVDGVAQELQLQQARVDAATKTLAQAEQTLRTATDIEALAEKKVLDQLAKLNKVLLDTQPTQGPTAEQKRDKALAQLDKQKVTLENLKTASSIAKQEQLDALKGREDAKRQLSNFMDDWGVTTETLTKATDNDWSLKRLHVIASDVDCNPAHGCTPARDLETTGAAGIRVCQPDTGYTKHAETWGSRLLADAGVSFVPGETSAADSQTGLTANHGTAASSVLFSDEGGLSPNHVTGVAPNALLIPLRVGTSIVVNGFLHRFIRTAFSNPDALARALETATDAERNCDVISIAMGGLGDDDKVRLQMKAVLKKGLIVVAAAGNYWQGVSYPGRYAERLPVVAAAATDASDKHWAMSADGAAVTISAPGHAVWRATFDGATAVVSQGSGTTFATGETAAVAALWLKKHGGRAGLKSHWGLSDNDLSAIPCAFRYLLKKTARVPLNWNKSKYGAGIVNAEALLNEPLPALAKFKSECPSF